MQRDDVTLRKQLLKRDILHSLNFLERLFPVRVESEDAHPESKGKPRGALPDFSGSDDPNRFSPKRHAAQSMVVKRAAFHPRIRLWNMTEGREEKCKDVFRNDMGTVIRDIADRDPLLLCCLQINVVIPHGTCAEEPQL